MKVTEHLDRAKNPLISFEIIPISRGGDINLLFNIVDVLMKYDPPFIDVTSHSAEVYFEETPTGIKKRTKRKKPGTIGISVAIKNKYNVDTVPHILCNGFTREETEDALIELNYLGIENVLAIKGDDKGFKKPVPEGRTSNIYAVDLVNQIKDMNSGKYLEEDLLDAAPTGFCIGVSGYPEKHFEAPNMDSDLHYLKLKVDMGADYIVTQMFFDNEKFYAFVKACRDIGITVPIIPGLKPIYTKKQLTVLPKIFHIDLPTALSKEIIKCKTDEEVEQVGTEWLLHQSQELKKSGVPVLHYYTLGRPHIVGNVVKEIL